MGSWVKFVRTHIFQITKSLLFFQKISEVEIFGACILIQLLCLVTLSSDKQLALDAHVTEAT